MIIFLPIPLLLQLNIKPAQKAGVVCLFLLGLFTTVCSILRLTQIHRVAYGDGNSTMLVLWGTIEFNVGVSTTLPRDPSQTLNVHRTSLPVFRTWLLFSRATYAISDRQAAENTMIVGAAATRWRTGPRSSDLICIRTHLGPRRRKGHRVRS
jgi:hypothetical protein